ncbi:MAG: hypothetical protein ACHQQ3_10780 [Gemmatimonadales bacterium]
MNEENPVDLSALDPTTPPAAFEARLAGVRGAARFALLRRRQGGNALFVVARWRAPLIAALLLVMLASAALLRSVQSETLIDAEPADEIADVVGDLASPDDPLLSTSTSTTDLLLGGYQR